MATPYGLGRHWARVALTLALLVSPRIVQARTIKLLVFGDSLAAGYGLPAPDAFQAQLGQALRRTGST